MTRSPILVPLFFLLAASVVVVSSAEAGSEPAREHAALLARGSVELGGGAIAAPGATAFLFLLGVGLLAGRSVQGAWRTVREGARQAERLGALRYWFESAMVALALFVLHWMVAGQGDWRLPAVFFATAVALRGVTDGVARRRTIRRLDPLLHQRRVLFVGVNDKTLAAYRDLGLDDGPISVVGFVDEPARRRDDIPWLGELDAFEDILRRSVVDAVFIALPLRSYYDQVHRIIQTCEVHGITVHYLLDLFASLRSSTKICLGSDGVTTLTLHTAPIDGVALRIKHAIDRLAAFVLLALASPLLLLAAIAIKLEDRGPVFFTQERVGYNKRSFRMLKLRTMSVDAEQRMAALEQQNQRDGAAFKIDNDPRITRVGRLLRKYSIDELPQLWNVLSGDMSLVGPRPLSMRDYAKLPMDWQRRRFSMRPGLTCYWQVRGRHQTTFLQWMQMDLEYIDNWSLAEDFKVLALTVPEVLRGGGA